MPNPCTKCPGIIQNLALTDSPNGMCCYEVYALCSGSGRPLLVGGRAITAAARPGERGGWRAELAVDVAGLSEREREALSTMWARDALLEHASVASFSRFALELMAVGAPADLVEGAHRAALDEVRHARLCFALASAYASRPIEPGPLDFGGSLPVSSDLATVAARAVVEGCCGETVAAVKAAEQHAQATDPAVRDVLAVIAEDEAGHAELAWRFVAWALRAGGEDVRRAVESAFCEARSADARKIFDRVVAPGALALLRRAA